MPLWTYSVFRNVARKKGAGVLSHLQCKTWRLPSEKNCIEHKSTLLEVLRWEMNG